MYNLQCVHSHLSRYNYLVAKKNQYARNNKFCSNFLFKKKSMYQKGFPKARQTPSFSCEDITNTVRQKIQKNLYCLPPKLTPVYKLFTELFFSFLAHCVLCIVYYYFRFKNLLPNHVAFLKVKRYIIFRLKKQFLKDIHENCLGLICCKNIIFLIFTIFSFYPMETSI